MSIEIDVKPQSDIISLVALDGSLDSETAPQLDAALDMLPATVRLVVLDMARLKFISSAGLRVIFKLQKRLRGDGGRVAVRNMPDGVRKVFEIVKALPDLTVFASVEEMDDYLATFQRPR